MLLGTSLQPLPGIMFLVHLWHFSGDMGKYWFHFCQDTEEQGRAGIVNIQSHFEESCSRQLLFNRYYALCLIKKKSQWFLKRRKDCDMVASINGFQETTISTSLQHWVSQSVHEIFIHSNLLLRIVRFP